MQTDYLVIGAGVTGICVARELKQRHPAASVVVIDKESGCARHSSGRNSGVLEAGFAWSSDTLAGRFCRAGNEELSSYCEQKGLPVNRCGELVVARDGDELSALDRLARRAEGNGIEFSRLDASEAEKAEPRARTHQQALLFPSSAVVDPGGVARRMEQDARDAGVRFLYEDSYLGRAGEDLITTRGTVQAGYVVNCAGLNADRIARDFGAAANYRLLPVKYLYLESAGVPGSYRTHIGAAADYLQGPWPGVRLLLGADGRARLGPAIKPALWREQYRGAEGFQPFEMSSILALSLGQMFQGGSGVCKLCAARLKGSARSRLVAAGARLAEGINRNDYRDWSRAEIQPQLVNTETHRLEEDFIIERGDSSIHLLNGISPLFTCSMPLARHICDQIEQ